MCLLIIRSSRTSRSYEHTNNTSPFPAVTFRTRFRNAVSESQRPLLLSDAPFTRGARMTSTANCYIFAKRTNSSKLIATSCASTSISFRSPNISLTHERQTLFHTLPESTSNAFKHMTRVEIPRYAGFSCVLTAGRGYDEDELGGSVRVGSGRLCCSGIGRGGPQGGFTAGRGWEADDLFH